ncbi:MAG: Stp1/IreP family PP2C-type Ser/Thr phosphatase [Lachnospiraceae bacterium]|nr:Stp1/IreP family PP2C-type Ser/Thr phosphatase [Lachnospiraceae bacterium]MDY4970663.1 Stp1/IreP family PP2C-type Ser/Thr phosphatase [Lachnospiraceae bacterium]
MEAFALSDVGMCREMNQDAVFAQCTPIGNLDNLFVVADGMGGHQAGDYASSYAIARIQELLQKEQAKSTAELFEWAFRTVNYEIFEKGCSTPEYYGMGTTMVACTLDKNRMLTAANVGDSRLYVYSRNKSIRQITRDHSYVEELVRKGQITRDSELYQQSKNVITRAIGAAENVKTDIFQLELEPEDMVLLCSDGLTNMVPDHIISLFLSVPGTLEEKAEKLIQEANHAGGTDNISVVLMKTEPAEQEWKNKQNVSESEEETRGL